MLQALECNFLVLGVWLNNLTVVHNGPLAHMNEWQSENKGETYKSEVINNILLDFMKSALRYYF